MAEQQCQECSRWRERAAEEQRRANHERRRADQYQQMHGELYAKVSSLGLWIQRQLQGPRLPAGFILEVQNRLKAALDQL